MSMQDALEQAVEDADRRGLAECETAIRTHKQGAWEFMDALRRIRDAELYLLTPWPTFEAYCTNHPDLRFTGRRGRQLVAAAVIRDEVPGVQTEKQARALHPLPEGERMKAWERARDLAREEGHDMPETRHLEAAVRERTGPLPPQDVPPEQREPEPGSEDKVVGVVGRWAGVARSAREVREEEYDIQSAHDLTAGQRWKLESARSHVIREVER